MPLAQDWERIERAFSEFDPLEEVPAGEDGDLPEFSFGHDIATKVIELPDELIEGVLHCGGKMMLGGGSKSFKTWCLADLAISMSTGRKWWGRKVKQGKVVYLNLEVRGPFFESRLQKISHAKGVSLSEDLIIWNLRGHCADHRVLLPRLAKRLKGMKVALIILDPTYKIMAGSENAQEEVAALMDSIEKMAMATSAAVCFGSHFAKGSAAGKEAIDRVSGSGVFARDPDAILTMTRHEEEGVFSVDFILRDSPPIEPFCVRWEFPLMHSAPEADPARLKEPGRASAKSKTPPPVEKVIEVAARVIGEKEISGNVNDGEGLVKVVEKELHVTRWAAKAGIEAAIGRGLNKLERRKSGRGGRSQVFYTMGPIPSK